MTDTTLTAPMTGLRPRIRALNALAGRLMPKDLVQLAARLFIGIVFWQSARTKVDGFMIKDQTYYLFENIYNIPLIPSNWAAVMATIGEHSLSVLIILGLAGRFSAAGLLVMTAVIEIFVFPEAWVLHGTWAASLLVVLAYGPGRLSLDHLLKLDR
ncbi:DoxX family protein [Pararhodobacter zhoushanensis]|uniref:DoxX family protein n=1 Tax=Pararhodobacter zhoushanensis TaxID=2479545 RepID=UPI000F8C7699|nr:DoxX family protein [Pararhodobacter zhoushanensis]